MSLKSAGNEDLNMIDVSQSASPSVPQILLNNMASYNWKSLYSSDFINVFFLKTQEAHNYILKKICISTNSRYDSTINMKIVFCSIINS